ncbi:MAG: hypothetical protein V3W44_03600, partial [Dehalococcoidales bacterium]
LPNFKRKTAAGEYSASCPQCGGVDRFLFWEDRGNYWCRKRQCGLKGFISDNGNGHLSDEDCARFMREAEERTRQRKEERQAALNGMADLDHIARTYHNQMTDRSYWYGQGLADEMVDRYLLGHCPSCPTHHASPSHTIPVFFRSKLLNIRHRLALPPSPGDKYRPHKAGLPAVIFNADVLLTPQDYVVLVEGEIKAMVLTQYGFPSVGIPGANIFKDRWVGWFAKQPTVYVALDPGADGHARDIALMLGGRARLVSLPVKPDDFFVLYGGTAEQLGTFLWQGRKVKC